MKHDGGVGPDVSDSVAAAGRDGAGPDVSDGVDPGAATDVTGSEAVDWEALTDAAREAMQHAYVPYSKYPVGAAALADDGRLITGANVENASYGLTLCAECSLVSALHMSGGGKIAAFTCVDGNGNILMPCGRCRQLLHEHRAPQMRLLTVSGIRTMDEVLPDAFGPQDLDEGRSS